jgi:predicted flap endonuclease-1-like 5' DNA nuclease/uncharacterized coiled-coil protein SlyX
MWLIYLQIFAYLLAAGLIGFLTGWFLSRITHSLRAVELAGKMSDGLKKSEEALAAARHQLAAERAGAASLQTEVARVTAALAERDGAVARDSARVKELEDSLAAQASQLDAREVALAEAAAEAGRLRAEAQSLAAKLAEAEESARRHETIHEAELQALRDGFGAKEQELARSLFRLKQLETQIRESEGRLEALVAAHERALGEKERELAALRARVTELELLSRQGGAGGEMQAKPGQPATETVGANPPPVSHSKAPEKSAERGQWRDDLKKIRGIGPALERLLNTHGVSRYRQIAAWTDAEIEEFGTKLDGFQRRIRRDDWVGGAKEAHFKQYGEHL